MDAKTSKLLPPQTRKLSHAIQFYLVIQNQTMMNFIYDSLDTVKKLKFPTKKEFIQLTIGIFVVVIVAGVVFVTLDTIFSGAYQTVYNMIRG